MTSTLESNNDLPSLDPCIDPSLDTVPWTEIALTDACTFRLPPTWAAQGIPERHRTEPPYLLCVYGPRDPNTGAGKIQAHLAAWLYARTGLPVAQYERGGATQVVDTRTCTVTVRGREVTVATWKTVTAGAESAYGVAACWPVGVNRWIHLSARMRTQGEQAEVVMALRTIHVRANG
jgi:hypothetical protein